MSIYSFSIHTRNDVKVFCHARHVVYGSPCSHAAAAIKPSRRYCHHHFDGPDVVVTIVVFVERIFDCCSLVATNSSDCTIVVSRIILERNDYGPEKSQICAGRNNGASQSILLDVILDVSATKDCLLPVAVITLLYSIFFAAPRRTPPASHNFYPDHGNSEPGESQI